MEFHCIDRSASAIIFMKTAAMPTAARRLRLFSLPAPPPQDAAARSRALAASRDARFDPAEAPWLQKCLVECSKPLQLVSKNDWLANGQPGDTNGDRKGESFAQFCRPGPRRSFPSKREKIYVTPLGLDDDDDAPDISVLIECLRAHFQMDVVAGKPIVGEEYESIEKTEG